MIQYISAYQSLPHVTSTHDSLSHNSLEQLLAVLKLLRTLFAHIKNECKYVNYLKLTDRHALTKA